MTGTLRIAAIPAGARGGAWGITLAPGKKDPWGHSGPHDRDLDADLDVVAAWGAAAVLTLVTEAELVSLGLAGLPSGVRARFMEWHWLPIADGGVPDARGEEAWTGLSASLRSLVARGERVLVHCRGGLGRAGMAVARMLVEGGMDPAGAVAAVRAARPGAVETAGQEAWVAAGRKPADGAPCRSDAATRDRAVGAMAGLAVGDAVGTTFEFGPKPARALAYDMTGGGPFRLEAGQWTDDTAMSLALAESLTGDPALDADDLMRRFVDWRENGAYSCTGTCFDIGNATSAALSRYRRTGNPLAGSSDPNSAGNGSIMRLAPVAVRHWRDRAELARVADLQSVVTHAAVEAREASVRLAGIIADAIEGRPLQDVLAGADVAGVRGLRPGQPRAEVEGTGYVVACLHAALWAVARTTSFREAVLAAANLGRDADTTAAVAGQVAGAVYGISGIPAEWLGRLAWSGRITELAGRLHDDGAAFRD